VLHRTLLSSVHSGIPCLRRPSVKQQRDLAVLPPSTSANATAGADAVPSGGCGMCPACCATNNAQRWTHACAATDCMRARQLTACVRGHVGKVSVRRRQKSSVWYLCHSAPAGDSETRRMVVSKRNVFCELVIGA